MEDKPTLVSRQPQVWVSKVPSKGKGKRKSLYGKLSGLQPRRRYCNVPDAETSSRGRGKAMHNQTDSAEGCVHARG